MYNKDKMLRRLCCSISNDANGVATVTKKAENTHATSTVLSKPMVVGYVRLSVKSKEDSNSIEIQKTIIIYRISNVFAKLTSR